MSNPAMNGLGYFQKQEKKILKHRRCGVFRIVREAGLRRS